LKNCELPLTGKRCVKKIVTELAAMEVTADGIRLLERAPGVTTDAILKSTDAPLLLPAGDVPEMRF
jgi:3-oxoacid CoA-transferase subunit B